MKGGKKFGSARGIREATGERLERDLQDIADADQEPAASTADELEATGAADAPPITREPAEGPAARRAERVPPPVASSRFRGGTANAETGVLASSPPTAIQEGEGEEVLRPPPAVLEVAKAVAQGKKGKEAYARYEPLTPRPGPLRPRRVLKSDEVEARLMEPDAHLAFALPEGAVLAGPDGGELLHLGNGVFATKNPLWVVEGWTVAGSEADRKWPDDDGEGPADDDAPAKVWKGEIVGTPPAWVEGERQKVRVAELRVFGEPDTTPEGEARLQALREARRTPGSAAFEAGRKIALAHPAAADALPPVPEGEEVSYAPPPAFAAFVQSTVERRARHVLEGLILDAPAEIGPPPPLDDHVAVRVEPKEGLIHPDLVLEARTAYGAELIQRYEAMDMPPAPDAA